MSDENYMKDHRAKTVEGFIKGLMIFSKYMAKGVQHSYFCGAEHDIVHIFVGNDALPFDSEDGKELNALGFHVQDGGWAYFT